MFLFFIILNVCTHLLGVLSSGLQDDIIIGDTVFDTDLLENALDPELCQQQLRNMRTFEFYDASFRVPQSISKGNTMGMGNFHQCLGITQDVEGDVIEGKYCIVNAQLKNSNFPVLKGKSWLEDMQWMKLDTNSTNRLHDYKNALARAGNFAHQIYRVSDVMDISQVGFSLALCIPKTCTVEDALRPVENNINYQTEICRLPGDKPMVPADYTAIVIFTTIGILTILSTAYDLHHRILLKKDPGANKLLRCCSVYTNTKSLMTFRSTSNAIDCVDGIRALSTMWIVVGHAALMYSTKYTVNALDFLQWVFLRKGLWITSAVLAVDTFLTLTGVLLVYTAAKKMKQMQLLKNLHVFYLNRLLRMFPLLACVVLLQVSVFHHVSDGAGWHEAMASGISDCREYWWSTLLHIQNIVNPSQNCLEQTWYLSVDMQLHILSPLILFWVLGSRRTAWSGLALGVIGGITASTVYILIRADLSVGDNNNIYYYKNTVARCSPFLIGMVLGYIMHIYREKKLKISVWFIGLGYIVSLVVAAYSINSQYEDRQGTQTELGLDLHRVFVRPAWGACVCWIIFACHQGYGGPINWFLSLTIWKFMARISYAMYLFHIPILTTISSSSIVPVYFTMENLWLMLASVMVYTVITSIAACVLIEAPCTTLQNMLLTALMPSAKTAMTKAPTPSAPEEIKSKHEAA